MRQLQHRIKLDDISSPFREDSPRPPVPGEEDKPAAADPPPGSKHPRNEEQDHASTWISRDGHGLALGQHSSAATGHAAKLHAVGTPRRCHVPGSSEEYVKSENVSDRLSERSSYGAAPLGFEPEGSSVKSAPFLESTSAEQSAAKPNESLRLLLEDVEGVKVFRQFVDEERGSSALEFWLACRGLKKVIAEEQDHGSSDRARNLARVIFKMLVKGTKLDLSPELKQSICERLKRGGVGDGVYDDAVIYVERLLSDVFYPEFVKSEAYLRYAQSKVDSPSPRTVSSDSSECSSVRPMSSLLLPTVHEDEELNYDDVVRQKTPTVSRNIQFKEESEKAEGFRFSKILKGANDRTRLLSPSSVPSAPVGSVQDSELQSLSSDALTDDTISLTDSSLDGRGDHSSFNNKFIFKKQMTAMRRNADANHTTNLNQQYGPDRFQLSTMKEKSMAEKEPEKFAALLTERLLGVHVVGGETNTNERTHPTCKNVEKQSEIVRENVVDVSKLTSSLPFSAIIAAMSSSEDADDDNAQSILESHMLRVFAGSSGQTPEHQPSPGRHSPPDPHAASFRCFPGAFPSGRHRDATPASNPSASFTTARRSPFTERPVCHNLFTEKPTCHRKMASAAGNCGGERPIGNSSEPVSTTHKCNHHLQTKAIKSRLAFGQSGAFSLVDSHRPTLTKTNGRQENGKGGGFGGGAVPAADLSCRQWTLSSSCRPGVDATTSIRGCGQTSLPTTIMTHSLPCPLDTASEKVMLWMLENEKVSSGKTQCSTDSSDKGSSRRRLTVSDGGVLPSQPIIQDPSMPLLNPPDPTTQLEEARRRLEEEASARMLEQSRCFCGSKGPNMIDENQVLSPLLSFPRAFVKNAFHCEGTSFEEPTFSSYFQMSENKMARKLATAMTPVRSSDTSATTGLIYYFCDEKIPYSTKIQGKQVTLAQVKQHLAKKGQFRYFFKRINGNDLVYEEIEDDNAIVPLTDGKISTKIIQKT